MGYIVIILVASIIVYVFNCLFNPLHLGWGYYAIATLIFIVLEVIVDALVALSIRKMPAKWFPMDKKSYELGTIEKKFYKFIGVPIWKDKVPELGSFTGFHKNKVANPYDNEYIGRFILEACYGISIHFWSVPFSILPIFIDYQMWTGSNNVGLTIGVPVAIVNMILIVLPAFILKWNLPMLKNIYKNNLRREERKRKKED